jgi:hypothetical protein
VVRWHREGFRRHWRSVSTPGPGRPPISEETKQFIVRMATESPTARWVIQQLRHAFREDPTHRFLIFDNDAIFSAEVVSTISSFGIQPRRTAFHSPWQNGIAERFIGSVRRELLDHVVVLSEVHLRRLLQEYVEYYNTERVHTSLSDPPEGRALEAKPSARRRSPPSLCLARRGLIMLPEAADQLNRGRG